MTTKTLIEKAGRDETWTKLIQLLDRLPTTSSYAAAIGYVNTLRKQDDAFPALVSALDMLANDFDLPAAAFQIINAALKLAEVTEASDV